MKSGPDNVSSIRPWSLLESKTLFTSKRLNLRLDACRLPSDRTIDDYLVVEMPDGAVVVAVTEQNEIVLVRQYKHGLGRIVLELPAGNVEKEEDPAITILRELKEETGYTVKDTEFITILSTKPARMTARTFVYFALNATKVEKQQENDMEVIENVLVPVQELPALIQRGEIITETSLAALLVVWHKIFKQA